MKIEPNKFYRTRDGRKARVLCTDAPRSECPALGYVEMLTGCIQLSWSKEGARIGGTESSDDLIAEWTDRPEVDWSAMPKWARFVAKDASGFWFYFPSKPMRASRCWLPCQNEGQLCEGQIPAEYAPKFAGDWKDSRVERPS